MKASDLFPIHAGFLPLLDSAILVTALERGFAREEGIDLHLARETSWANIRDRMAVGHFDVAHMLAPMPIAASLGLSQIPLNVIAPMALGLGGNAVTVSKSLHNAMVAANQGPLDSPLAAGSALNQTLKERIQTGERKPVFAVVHPYSGHNYELRYWLAANGIMPERDLDLVIVPPPLMSDALKAGTIDGFCVGEPWNSVAVAQDAGVIIATKSEIWRCSPEKVLGVSAQFADSHPEILGGLLRALVRAAIWCGDAGNHDDLATLLSQPHYINLDKMRLAPALSGQFPVVRGTPHHVEDFFLPFERAATFPWKSHALWFYSQMVRWGQVEWNAASLDKVSAAYRPDIYRGALKHMGLAIPAASSKVEGALERPTPVGSVQGTLLLGPDGFFDGQIFDPDEIENYIKAQAVD